MSICQLHHPLIAIFRRIIEPTSTISDPIQRQHLRLLNTIVFFFIPVAIIGGVIHLLIDLGDTPLLNDTAIINIIVPCVLLSLAAFCGRYVGYSGAILLVFLAGYASIMINASFDSPDYFDLSYLILLTVLATMLFDTKIVLLIVAIEIASIIMVTVMVSLESPANLIIFSIVGNLVLTYTGQYRNQLEADRRQKLAESETFLRLITDQLPVSVWITDEKLKRRATFGRIQGMEQLVTIPTNTAIKAYYQALGGKSAQFEDTRNKRQLQYYVEPMRDSESKIIGTLGVATDITEQKLAQQQLLQLELERGRVDMLSKFIEYSSHDLRTPLSNINTYLYLLDKAVQSDKERGYIQVIREQSDRLHELIDNMLTLQRLELESDSERTKVSLKSLLHEVETSVRSRIEAELIVFEYSSPEQDAVLNINKQHIHTALMKIIDNAIQFTSESGSIRLSATSDDQSVTISVQDTGMGMLPEKIPHIFELFYRGDESRPTSDGDNGLGLAITDRIIKSHKGTIRVDSIVDEGSTFYVTLPIANSTSIYR